MQGDNRTILISSHQLTDLERFADHAAIINRGKLLASGRMDQLVERYQQVDAQIGRETALAVAGINVIAREGDRVRLLIDRQSMPADGFAQLEVKEVQEVPLTLEELFLTLIRVADARSGWWPQMSAA
jgi:ABC-2 type transport system ATP-binding protein